MQSWCDQIYDYLKLIRHKEGKVRNWKYIISFARCTHIQNPESMTRKELSEGLQLAWIRKAELRRIAAGLRQAHLRECLIQAQVKKQ
jgi:hypothetical protein